MFSDAFVTVDVREAQAELSRLHKKVVQGKGRIELCCEDVEGTSVLISKEELECLERALAILSDGENVREMTQRLQLLATTAQTDPASCNV